MKPLEVWTCQRAENLKKSSKISKNNYAAKMVSAARRKIIGGGGGGAPINKSRRRRRLQIVGGGGAARPAHGSTRRWWRSARLGSAWVVASTCYWVASFCRRSAPPPMKINRRAADTMTSALGFMQEEFYDFCCARSCNLIRSRCLRGNIGSWFQVQTQRIVCCCSRVERYISLMSTRGTETSAVRLHSLEIRLL